MAQTLAALRRPPASAGVSVVCQAYGQGFAWENRIEGQGVLRRAMACRCSSSLRRRLPRPLSLLRGPGKSGRSPRLRITDKAAIQGSRARRAPPGIPAAARCPGTRGPVPPRSTIPCPRPGPVPAGPPPGWSGQLPDPRNAVQLPGGPVPRCFPEIAVLPVQGGNLWSSQSICRWVEARTPGFQRRLRSCTLWSTSADAAGATPAVPPARYPSGDISVAGERLGVQAVGLGQLSAGLGEGMGIPARRRLCTKGSS